MCSSRNSTYKPILSTVVCPYSQADCVGLSPTSRHGYIQRWAFGRNTCHTGMAVHAEARTAHCHAHPHQTVQDEHAFHIKMAFDTKAQAVHTMHGVNIREI